MDTLGIYRIGSKVKLENSIKGTIISVWIKQGISVFYEIAWWNGMDYRTEFMSSSQFEPENYSDTRKIGFHE